MCSNTLQLNYVINDSFPHAMTLPVRWMFVVIPKGKTKGISLNWRKYTIFYFFSVWCLSPAHDSCQELICPIVILNSLISSLSEATTEKPRFFCFVFNIKWAEGWTLQGNETRCPAAFWQVFPWIFSWLWFNCILISEPKAHFQLSCLPPEMEAGPNHFRSFRCQFTVANPK